MNGTKEITQKTKQVKKRSQFLETLRSVFKSPSAKVGGVLFAIILIVAIFANYIAPYDPYEINLSEIRIAPNSEHICGTDSLGRDLFSRIICGAKYSLVLGLISTLIGTAAGVILGSIAGYFGGIVENLIMRFCDIWTAIPGMLLTMIIASSLGAGFMNTVIAMSIGTIPNGARLTRGQILAERSKEYLEAAESINTPKTAIMFRHLLPNVISPTIVGVTMGIGGAITGAAGLTYLGLGVQPPLPEWGALVSDGTAYIWTDPYLMIYPGIVIGVCVLAINLMGDGLRDALDPKLRS